MSEENKSGMENSADEIDILQTAVDYMGTFLDEARMIVSEFRGGNYSRIKDIGNLFEGFQWIYMAVGKIQADNNAKIGIDSERVIEAMKNATEALENSDAVLLTDILEYEVIEMVQDWYGSE